MSPQPHPLLPLGARGVITDVLERTRDSVCTVQKPTGGLDATGAPTGGYTTTTVATCRVRPPGRVPYEGSGGARFAPVVDYEIFFSPAVDVTAEDHIVVNGRTLRVVADQDAASHGFETRVMARAVEA